MTWSITRLVGCEHILQIQTNEATPVPVANSTGPDGELTGPGRPGKQRIAFILNSTDLSNDDEGANEIAFAIDSGIAFQAPPNALAGAGDAAEYNVNTPLDLSTFIPIMHVTPLAPSVVTDPDGFIAWEAKPYLLYNQATAVGSRFPAALSQAASEVAFPNASPNPNGQITTQFATANNVFTFTPSGQTPFAGSFLVEIDFSHSIAS